MKKSAVPAIVMVCVGIAIAVGAHTLPVHDAASAAAAEAELAAAETEAEGTEETTEETEEAVEEVYAYEYDALSMVDLGDYSNLTYTIEDTSVTDEEIDEHIQSVREASSTYEEITDRAVEDGDTINYTCTGYYADDLDGDPFQEEYTSTLTIGSGSTIDGFEDGLIGQEVGDCELDLTFPDDYSNTDLAGQEAVFKITINYIQGDEVVPELDDAFVESLSIDGVSTVDEYREYVKQQLQTDKEDTAESDKQQELFQEVVEASTVNEYPEELVAYYEYNYRSYYESYASYFSMTLEEFLDQSGSSEEEFEAAAQEYGKNAAGSMLVMAAIAQNEGYEVTDDVYQEELEALATANGYEDGAALEEQYSEAYLKQVIISNYVAEVLENNATGVEAAETEAETETAAE